MLKKIVVALAFVGVLFAAQNFTLHTIDGKTIHLTIKKNGMSVKEYPNKVIILEFFGKHCPPCRAEMPILGKLQKKLAKKLQIIGIHVQQPLDKVDVKMLKNRGVDYPVVDYLTNKENEEFVSFIARLTGWSGSIPYMLFFDKNGEYEGYHLGMANEESLEKFINRLYSPAKK